MKQVFFKASARLREEFLKYPETGMGYQILHFKNERSLLSEYHLILNGEIFSSLDSINYMLSEVKSKNFDTSSIYSYFGSKVALNEIEEINQYPNKQQYGLGPATSNPPQEADGNMRFVRLSPYRNDFRIDFENKSLKPGTYTTTMRDYLKCKEVFCDPVERYALPSEEDVKWEFHVQPNKGDKFRLGTVQPANGQLGGGEEALFDEGTSKNTLTLIREFSRFERY